MVRGEKRLCSEITSDKTDLKLTDLLPTDPDASQSGALAPEPDQLRWVANKGLYYPFCEAKGQDVVEFRVRGTVMNSYLKGGKESYSHTVMLDVFDKDIDVIKSYGNTAPTYNPDNFRYSININTVKFVSKVDVYKPFEDVWEIKDERLYRNEKSRVPISWERVVKGVPVWVEYTIVAYDGRDSSTEGGEKFGPGATLRLLSIGMLSDVYDKSQYNFGSLKRRQRSGEKS